MAADIQQLVAALSCNPELRIALEAATTTAQALEVVRRAGLDWDDKDLATLSTAARDPSSLTDSELDSSAGGVGNPHSIYVCGPTEVLCTATWL